MVKYILISTFYFSFSAFGQVGINTSSPQSTLQINSNSTQNIPLLELFDNQDKRFIITKDGNVGINEITPDNKLVIDNGSTTNTGLKLKTGAGEGYKLTSDANGNAYWDARSVQVLFGDKDSNVASNGVNVLTFGSSYYLGSKIELPAGKWALSVGIFSALGTINAANDNLVNVVTGINNLTNVINTDSSIWCSCFLSNDNSSNTSDNALTTGDFLPNSGKAVATSMGRGMNRMVMEGSILLNLSSAKTVYLKIKCTNMGATTDKRPAIVNSNAWENWFYATPL